MRLGSRKTDVSPPPLPGILILTVPRRYFCCGSLLLLVLAVSIYTLVHLLLQEELESVQKRAARFVTGNYNYETGSMTGILGQLKWESLKKRRKDNRLILLYKGLKGKASVPTDDLIPKTRRCRNQHSMAFQTPIANTDVYKGSFFPQTIRDWNALPDSLISSAEDAEDCIAKFTSLVRARD